MPVKACCSGNVARGCFHFHHFVGSIQTFLLANIAFWCKSIKYTYAYTFHKLRTGTNIFPSINHPSDILITLYKLGKQPLRK